MTFQDPYEPCLKYTLNTNEVYFNPFAPGDFTKKRVLKLVEWFSGAKTYHKLVYGSYTSRPSDPHAKYQLAKFGQAKFRDLGLKVTQQS